MNENEKPKFFSPLLAWLGTILGITSAIISFLFPIIELKLAFKIIIIISFIFIIIFINLIFYTIQYKKYHEQELNKLNEIINNRNKLLDEIEKKQIMIEENAVQIDYLTLTVKHFIDLLENAIMEPTAEETKILNKLHDMYLNYIKKGDKKNE